ncbi:hypothetical protein [Streptosporangium amethystogenes]|uniref:hypothetical protein n=1 Tax=Streptosporangium amethystogenes TaxID=2002 RepID=UPI0012FBFC9F|nr:hypothetical protein [Streptosporangium amethystogenes]
MPILIYPSVTGRSRDETRTLVRRHPTPLGDVAEPSRASDGRASGTAPESGADRERRGE